MSASVPLLVAHGVGERGDLPLPLSFFMWGATVALVVSFAAVGVLWSRPTLRAAAGRVRGIDVRAAVWAIVVGLGRVVGLTGGVGSRKQCDPRSR